MISKSNLFNFCNFLNLTKWSGLWPPGGLIFFNFFYLFKSFFLPGSMKLKNNIQFKLNRLNSNKTKRNSKFFVLI